MSFDKNSVRSAYEDVRNDSSDTMWVTFKYEGKTIVHEASGSDFDEFSSKFQSDERGFGFLRVTTGDEMSKRAKFVFFSWCGPDVGGLKRAKIGADKSALKQVIQNFAVELQLSEMSELDLDSIAAEVRRAGGANYGSGVAQ